jgi:hypothetical protein
MRKKIINFRKEKMTEKDLKWKLNDTKKDKLQKEKKPRSCKKFKE